MSPTKDSKILSVRVRNSVIAQIMERANRRGLTLNGWLSEAIKDRLRSHSKRK